MTVIQWSDGNILTAGSLRLIPQFYSLKTGVPVATSGAAGTWETVGSEYVSGGLFSQTVLIDASWGGYFASAGSFAARLFVSGAGLGGGSQVYLDGYTVWGTSQDLHPRTIFALGSNSGWIPGSACVIFMQTDCNVTPSLSATYHLRIDGTGKP